MNKQNIFLKVGFPILGGLLILVLVRIVYAFQVPPLPDDNLLQNPWFRDPQNPSEPSFDQWTNVSNDWTLSQKLANPSPNAYISGECDVNNPTYCGTAAKLSADDGNGQVGEDSYIYQVVSSNPEYTKLKFSTHWVAHLVDPFEVNIYGSHNAGGPWTHVWTPVYQQVLTMLTPPPGQGTSWLWIEMTSWTPPVEKILPNGFPYYKVEVHANLPSPEGFKLTGIYFASEEVAGPPETPTPEGTPHQTPEPTVSLTPPFRPLNYLFIPVVINKPVH